MGTWHTLRMAFILGSLFTVLLIIVYWDDIGGFNLYPPRERSHTSPPYELHLQVTSGPPRSSSTSRARKSFPSDVPTTASSKTLVLEDNGGTVEEERKEQEEDVVEQEARKKRIADVCSGNVNVEFPGRTRTFEQIPNRELDHLIVDDTHHIIYCYVPKVTLSRLVGFVKTGAVYLDVSSFCSFSPRLSGSMHQLEESDGGPVPVSGLALRETLH